jgi:hypothetical protein
VTLEVDGQKFEIKLWSVKERDGWMEKILDAQDAVKDFSKITRAENSQLQKFTREFVAEQIGKPLDFVESMDGVTFDRLFNKILESNRAPKPS